VKAKIIDRAFSNVLGNVVLSNSHIMFDAVQSGLFHCLCQGWIVPFSIDFAGHFSSEASGNPMVEGIENSEHSMSNSPRFTTVEEDGLHNKLIE
jgi:hypothetical protein